MSQKKKSMLLFLVVALLLVLSLVAVFFLNSHNEQGEIARIYQDGKLIREVSPVSYTHLTLPTIA